MSDQTFAYVIADLPEMMRTIWRIRGLEVSSFSSAATCPRCHSPMQWLLCLLLQGCSHLQTPYWAACRYAAFS